MSFLKVDITNVSLFFSDLLDVVTGVHFITITYYTVIKFELRDFIKMT